MLTNHHPASRGLAVAVLFVISMAGCAEKKTVEPPPAAKPVLQRVEEGQARQESLRAEYKAMPVTGLAEKLDADSGRDVEPFNSLAYREVVSRDDAAGRELAAFIKTPDRTSFLSLLAVRNMARESYDSLRIETRAAILTDALRTSKHFNTWGLPHLYWEDAARAVIELGPAAAAPLKALLQDARDAPTWGSEEAMEYQKYKYRVKDYAWALLMEIEGRKVEIPVDPPARDALIVEMSK